MNVKEIDVEGVVLPNVPLSNIQLNDAAKRLNLPALEECSYETSYRKSRSQKRVAYLTWTIRSEGGLIGLRRLNGAEARYISIAMAFLPRLKYYNISKVRCTIAVNVYIRTQKCFAAIYACTC